ncbi:MAG: (S)-ureidoglycine aminohydrolase [Alphaproteobacteria bacterium]|nr:(S)-ureidoglycine aminohydrolase [Alphaproteobacteria bacterium]
MPASSYYAPPGGLPPQRDFTGDKSRFTPSYLMIDKIALTDITASLLPQWRNTRLWVLARPMTGFSETFSHYIMDVAAGGGSDHPDDDANAEAVLFVVAGEGHLTLDGQSHALTAGSYAFISPSSDWALANSGQESLIFHWIRKRYQPAAGIEMPPSFVTHDDAVKPIAMPDTDGKWATTRFVDPSDLRHDMHVNIVTFQPGGVIPFAETHVMEHGLYMLEGEADYYVNQDWIPVEAGDYLWLRAFSPQACIAKGNGPFRYLLYKDVNRQMPLTPGGLSLAGGQ